MKLQSRQSQQGATLVVGLIMLVLITLMVTSAFTLSTGNLKSVGNMQVREESIAAANVAIERIISSDEIFFTPAASTVPVPPYSVTVAPPVCIASAPVPDPSSAEIRRITYVITYWDIRATVSDSTTGANVTLHQGIKIKLPADPDPCA